MRKIKRFKISTRQKEITRKVLRLGLDLPAAGTVERFDSRATILRADALMARYDQVLAALRDKSHALTRSTQKNEQLLLQMLDEKHG